MSQVVLLLLILFVLLLLVFEYLRLERTFAISPAFCILTGAFFLSLGTYLATRADGQNSSIHFSHSYSSGDLATVLLKKKLNDKNGRLRFLSRILFVNGRKFKGKIYVTIVQDSIGTTINAGDTLWTIGTIKRIPHPKNPGEFDFKSYAAIKNVHHQIYLKDGDYVLKPGKVRGLLEYSTHLNALLQRVLEKTIQNPREVSLAKALLLGSRSEMPDELVNRYKGAGAMHILAISGLHVGVIHLIFFSLTRPLLRFRKGQILRMLITLFGLWAYVFITGLAVSAIRAVSMFSLLSVSYLINRRTNLLTNLVNSAFILLLMNPLYLFDVSFQMSYSALTGIAMGLHLSKFFKEVKSPRSKIVRYVKDLILVTCSAQFGILPVSLYYFNQFSGLFLISSLILLPVLSATLISGYFLVFLSLFLNLHPSILNIYESWLWIFNSSVEWLGGLDELIFQDVYFPLVFCFFSCLALGMFTIGIIKGEKQLAFGFAGCLIVMQLVWIHQRAGVIQSEELLVFQEYGADLIVKRKGSVLEFNNRGSLSEKQEQIIAQYESELPGFFSYRFDEKGSPSRVLVDLVNESLVCVVNQQIEIEEFNLRPDILIFSDAPRMNLTRTLRHIRPKIVVADGSNSPGFVKRCRSTCRALGIDFHSTFAQGAFQYPK